MFKFLIGFMVFVAWTMWARQVYICEIRHLCQQEVFADSTTGKIAALRIGSTGNVIGSAEQFTFRLASSTPILNAGSHSFLRRLSKYFQPGQSHLLKITGRYSEAERTVSAGMYENLGLARAARLRDTLVRQYQVPASRIWIDSEQVEDTDPESANAPEEALVFQLGKEDMPLPLARYEFTNMTFSDANFRTNDTLFTPTLPFVMYADSLEKYCRQHPRHYIWIAAYTYTRDAQAKREAKSRAEAVKKYLQRTKGIQTTVFTDTKIATQNTRNHPSLTIQIYQSN